MWDIYAMEYYSATKNNEIMSFAARLMDLEIIVLSEVSQRQLSWYHLYVKSKNSDTKGLIYKTEIDSQT